MFEFEMLGSSASCFELKLLELKSKLELLKLESEFILSSSSNCLSPRCSSPKLFELELR